MPGSNFYNALANARQQTEKLKQQKLVEINATSGALANERSRAEDRKAKQAQFDQELAFNREKMGFDAANRDKQFANALEIANISSGTKRDVAGQGNLTRKEIEEMKQRGAGERNTLTNDTRQYVAEQGQTGANNRTTQNIDARATQGQLEREFQEAQQKRGIQSREGMNSENNAVKERIAQHAADLRAKAQESLEKHRNAQLSWQQASGTMKQAWKEQMDRAELEYKALTGEMKAAEAVLMAPEAKEELGGKFKSLPGSLRGGQSFNQPAASPQYAPGQDVTETGTPADAPLPDDDMEPMARSMVAPMPQPSQGKPVTQSQVEQPQAAPVQPSNGVTPNEPQYKAIARKLIARDKGLVQAGQMSEQEYLEKKKADAWSGEAISMINAAGLAEAKTKNNKVTGEPVTRPMRLNETTDIMGNTLDENTWSSLPNRAVRSVAGGLAHAGAGAIDTVTGLPASIMQKVGGTIIPMLPGSEKNKADVLSQLADLRGTKLSSLSNPEVGGGNVTDARYAGLGEAGAEVAGLVGGKYIPKLVGAAATKLAPNASKSASEFVGSKAKDLWGFLNRPLSDLGGKGAAKEAATAEIEAALQAELKDQAERMAAKRAEAAMAKSTANEADAVALNEQLYDDMYMNAVPEGQEALKKMDFKAMFSKPQAPAPSGKPWQMNASAHAPVEVSPTTGIRTLPLDEAAAPQTLPIDMPDVVPPKMWNPGAVADQGLGSMSPVDSQASGMFKGALEKPPVQMDAPWMPGSTPPPPEGGGVAGLGDALAEMRFAMDRMKKPTPQLPQMPAAADIPQGTTKVQGGFSGAMSETPINPPVQSGFALPRSPDFIPFEMQKAARSMGISPQQLFEMLQKAPHDLLPTAQGARTPEGALAAIQALKAGGM